MYGMLSGQPSPFPLFKALTESIAVRGFVYSEIVADPERLAAAKAFTLGGSASNARKPIIDKTFPFDQIVEAHRYLDSNEQMGNIIVTQE